PVVDMALGIQQNLGAALCLEPECSKVRHGSGREEERTILVQDRTNLILETANGWVTFENVVANNRTRDCFAHAGHGPGDGVAAEVCNDLGGHVSKKAEGGTELAEACRQLTVPGNASGRFQ